MEIVVSKNCIDYDYSQNLLLQKVEMREEFIWILQHDAIFTFGKKFENIEIPNQIGGFLCKKSQRGGDITFHNSGQIVIYFCLDVKKFFEKRNLAFDLSFIINLFEEIIIQSLKKYSISGLTDTINRGIFIKDKLNELEKIAFIGINFKKIQPESKLFLLNGFAINFNNNLEPFKLINPCGLKCKISSVEKFYNDNKINQTLSINQFIQDLQKILSNVFY